MRFNKLTFSHRKSIYCKILRAALLISKKSGWSSVSMRKIAEAIGYTPPVIYEYFENKAALLLGLTRYGFVVLSGELMQARSASAVPKQQLLLMCKAYWDFASDEPELYRLMFGVGTTRSDPNGLEKASAKIDSLFCEVIGDLPLAPYYTCWSVLHGLIAIKLIGKSLPWKISEQIFAKAVSDFTNVLVKN
ncbi:TetR/AcrR family transcriptional regulator [Pedobacter metabolipauper]|uniref:TetR family transcriptional regulator n=1 Tax=Pedobacter metabolipauper TaxID=425513 RepID=A0A4R6SS56_9SPHI|nr:TetR/AcrR family transcriptional regulator [Pedobacter metabolipauper]TDQ08117.1 TetR family transcriptional regulator [Pedobacter metabolipauper]